MRRLGLAWVGLIGLALANAGCATITSGTTQPIVIDSDPAGADCRLTREGTSLGTVRTPGTITVKRHAKPINVVCTQEGYEEARAVMNARAESASFGNALLGGAIGIMVDASTGANSRYESSLKVGLTPLSPADQAAVAAARASALPASSSATAGPYDGQYEGGVDLAQLDVQPPVLHRREFVVRVSGGAGIGTVRHPLCQDAGEVTLTIDPSGAISGAANTRNTTGCTQRMAALEGRIDRGTMQLSIRVERRTEAVELSLHRQQRASPVVPAAAAPGPAGLYDGEYGGGLEVGPGDLRQVRLRIRGTRVTGTSRLTLCPRPGRLVMTADPSGVLSGEINMVAGGSCEARKAAVAGRVDGRTLLLTFTFEDGRKSREYAFARLSQGEGVDD